MLLLENRIEFLGKGLCSAIGKIKINLKFKKWDRDFFFAAVWLLQFFFINLEEAVYLLQLPQPEILGPGSPGQQCWLPLSCNCMAGFQ